MGAFPNFQKKFKKLRTMKYNYNIKKNGKYKRTLIETQIIICK